MEQNTPTPESAPETVGTPMPDVEAAPSAEAAPKPAAPKPAETEQKPEPATVPFDVPWPVEKQKLLQQVSELNDRLMRSQAELENFRKRSQREIADIRKFAALPLLRDLVPVVDNAQRALDSMNTSLDLAGLKQGFEMLKYQMETALQQHGCQRIPALHLPFDPNLHEALMQQPTSEHPPLTVVQELRAGFQLHERVVRPTQVAVAVAPPAAS